MSDDKNCGVGRVNIGYQPDGHTDSRTSVSSSSPTVESTVELKRELGLFSGIGLIVGTMIGSGIFVSPGGVLKGCGSVGLSLLIWGGCGLISSIGALCYVELGCLIPLSGGEMVYIKASLGNFVSFIFSWMRGLVVQPVANAVIGLAFSEYSISLIPGYRDICGQYLELAKRLLTLFTLILITVINIWSVRLAARVQIIFTFAKLSAIAIVIVGGVVRLYQGYTENLALGFTHLPGLQPTTASTVVLSFYSGLWSYDGWNQLNYVTEELKDPIRNLKWSIMIGIPLVSALYTLVNVSYLTVLTPLQIYTSSAVATDWAHQMLGSAAILMPVSVALSTLGALNGCMFTASRVCYSSGREGHLPSILSFVNINKLSPFPALIFTGFMSCAFVFLGDIDRLIGVFSFASWLFYGLTFLSLIIMRWTRKDADRPFKVWIVFPVLLLMISCYFTVAPILDDPEIEYLYVVGFLLIGVVFYFLFVFTSRFHGYSDRATIVLQKILNIVPCEHQE